MRDMAAKARLASKATPGLPIDGDVVETRVPIPEMSKLIDGILDKMMIEKSPFFDEICTEWERCFPGIPAKPGRWQNGRLFLYVKTSGQLFSLRARLPKIKKTLATFSSAPRRFSVHLEIH